MVMMREQTRILWKKTEQMDRESLFEAPCSKCIRCRFMRRIRTN